jgi:hypothetical protein
MSSFEPIKKGFDPRKSSTGGGSYFKIDAGESADIVILSSADDILSCEQCAIWLDEGNSPVWVYTGGDDPSNVLGIPRAYRAYVGIYHDGEAKVWSLSKTVHNMLLEISDAGALVPGAMVRVKRTGTGLKTRYAIVPRGKTKDVSDVEAPDIIESLGPITSEGVWEMMVDKLGMDRESIIKKYGKRKKAVKKTVEPVDEDDSLEEVDLDDIDI